MFIGGVIADAMHPNIDQAFADVVIAEANLEKAEERYEPYENKSEDNVTRARLLSQVADAQEIYDSAVRNWNYLLASADGNDRTIAEADLGLEQSERSNTQEA